MKVLIIEQEKTFQQSLFLFMERYKNYEVFLASSKREGISLFQTFRFDMVLCGDRLPDGNGLEILKEWMEKNPKLISILMTVRGDDLLRQEAMKAGIRGYLEKPFDLKQLEEIIIPSNPPLEKGGEGGFNERR
jgi:DNA-binding NtrC family response regulator